MIQILLKSSDLFIHFSNAPDGAQCMGNYFIEDQLSDYQNFNAQGTPQHQVYHKQATLIMHYGKHSAIYANQEMLLNSFKQIAMANLPWSAVTGYYINFREVSRLPEIDNLWNVSGFPVLMGDYFLASSITHALLNSVGKKSPKWIPHKLAHKDNRRFWRVTIASSHSATIGMKT